VEVGRGGRTEGTVGVSELKGARSYKRVRKKNSESERNWGEEKEGIKHNCWAQTLERRFSGEPRVKTRRADTLNEGGGGQGMLRTRGN